MLYYLRGGTVRPALHLFKYGYRIPNGTYISLLVYNATAERSTSVMVICRLLTLTWLIYCELLRCSFFLPCSQRRQAWGELQFKQSYVRYVSVVHYRTLHAHHLTGKQLNFTTAANGDIVSTYSHAEAQHKTPNSIWIFIHGLYTMLRIQLWLWRCGYTKFSNPQLQPPPRNRPSFLWPGRDGSRGVQLGYHVPWDFLKRRGFHKKTAVRYSHHKVM